MAEKAYLAVDMGASSGRHVLGLFDGQQLRIEEVFRFDNGPVEVAGRLYWDLLGQWANVREGLRAARVKHGEDITSIGVDTWGVDFGLLGSWRRRSASSVARKSSARPAFSSCN
jgi:rhamnulokinase